VKILNTHAGIGGNRELWGDEHDVTAVEFDPAIAAVYQQRFPNDTVIVGDAFAYVEKHFAEFDFIWMSPSCPTHGQLRYNIGVKAKGYAPVMPDMTLYAAIVFLMHHHEGLWVVENVVPYYEPLIPPTVQLQRHPIWANFNIPQRDFAAKGIRTRSKLSDFANVGVDLSASGIKNKRQVFRNMVDPELGKHILDAAVGALRPATVDGGLLDLLEGAVA
jgi:DNA (cytosine-5)-methyltransferase 1